MTIDAEFPYPVPDLSQTVIWTLIIEEPHPNPDYIIPNNTAPRFLQDLKDITMEVN